MTTYDLILADARIVTPTGVIERGWVGVTDGVIAAIEAGGCSEQATDIRTLDGAWLGPGFIDVHVHGSMGIDVMDTDEDGLHTLSRFFAGHGVTSYLVGTYTQDRDRTVQALQVIGNVVGQVSGGASILGVYMEGPFLNPLRKGAHNEQILRPIDRDEVRQYLDTGIVRAIAFAPELPNGEWLIRELVGRGITAVAGHTDGTYEQIAQAQRDGVTSITHAFNGMRGLHHREPGTAGAALLLDGLVCEVISDGVHIAPELMKLFWRMKGPHGIALITDAGPFGGLPDGHYSSHDKELEIDGGVGRLPNGTISSSAKTYDYDFALFCRYAGVSFDEAWPAASAVPARIAGVADRKGTLELGKDADLVVLDTAGAVIATVACGEWIVGANRDSTDSRGEVRV